jgi:hypothetical protein
VHVLQLLELFDALLFVVLEVLVPSEALLLHRRHTHPQLLMLLRFSCVHYLPRVPLPLVVLFEPLHERLFPRRVPLVPVLAFDQFLEVVQLLVLVLESLFDELGRVLLAPQLVR